MRWRLRVRRRKVKPRVGKAEKGWGMTLGPSGRRQEPLYIVRMAGALVLAAFLGGALGLVWQATGFGDDRPAEVDSPP